jgi:putative addiction module killer protein
LAVLEVQEYIDVSGRSPFARWFDDLSAPAAAKVTVAITRLAQENFSNVKSVGFGVLEYRIDFGPGYRVYFGKDGARLVILLEGGSKKRQSKDVAAAIERWKDYRSRK